MNAPRFGLPATAAGKICSVFARHPQVEKAVLYGSRAKGSYKNGSDIDLTLQGSRLVFQDLLKIMGELDDLLLPYTIDLSLFASLTHPELLNHIRRMGVVFYERKTVEAKH